MTNQKDMIRDIQRIGGSPSEQEQFENMVCLLYYRLSRAGVFDVFPTFTNHHNLCAFIACSSKMCEKIYTEPMLARTMIEKGGYLDTWTQYMACRRT